MQKQHGNALFLILIAVALFAALSYAVTSSGRSSGGIEKEQAKIDQAVMDNYMAALDAGRLRLRITGGCDAIDYTAPADQGGGDKSCHMFHPDGGGVAWQDILDSCEVTGTDLTTLAVGESCGDMVYAGTSGGNRIYAMASDQGGSVQWSAAFTTVPRSYSDGLANTDAMLGLSDTTYAAAELCRSLGPKWYLPARDELALLYSNRNTGDLAGTFTTSYWSSTQRDAGLSSYAWYIWFGGDGTPGVSYKTNGSRVRCVRRD